jgi:tRNA (cmo5U34)-methyltransferase
LLDVQEDLIQRLLTRHDHDVERFLDLGCGTGAMSELVLAAGGAGSRSTGVLVDFSEPMLERVSAQLAGFPGRWQVVRGDLSSASWREGLPAGRYDAVVSGLAIHHLASERKRALFGELLALLEPGGLFVNMDYVSIDGPLQGLFDERMLANAMRAASSPEGEGEGNRHAGGRHSEHASFPEGEHEVDLDDGEDQPDTVEDQLRWLRDAGFEQAEVYFKWAEAAVFGAVKP